MSTPRRLLLAALGLLALAAAATAAALTVWRHPQRLLTVDSGNVKADVIVLLGGGSQERPERAAELFQTGAAPRILVSGAGDNDLNIHLLETSGVPASAISSEDKSISTLENAQFSVPLLRKMKARRVILVTTWYHSRRALACFEHVAPGMTFYSRPSYFAYPRRQWTQRNVNICVKAELVKLPGYWLWYGVWPFPLS